MNLSSILLTIINKLDGERTIYAGFHLLRGKRSGQTLQDVEYYGLKPFFGLLPKLRIVTFDEAANRLIELGYIATSDDSLVTVTEKGRLELSILPSYRFYGWDYRGREMIFYGRLTLTVQTMSNIRAGKKSFMPIQKDMNIQTFVKKLLYELPIKNPLFSRQVGEELTIGIIRSEMSDLQKVIFTHRLAGYGLSGWTWDQLAESLKLNPFTIRLMFIESLHMLLTVIESSTDLQLLQKMAADIKVSSYLTESSTKTKRLFDQGMSIEEIATARQLKVSTIEDHFVEMSINNTDFPLQMFVSEEETIAVIAKMNELGTKRLRLLKDEFKSLTYFQLRLILGARTGEGA
ncbi:helix-turn-helix domain-containing protein [Filibacter tadaridae]|uniref:Helicase Helix-turn-helix domain-containing protein n=1 Tax=Filibacter tadaridae TaxID=2483811 RepID=A0A3P5XKZ0_9BACL|nr:helix-turn-helix domain-containing protein [Filibacter tadaridae]VDC29302.1 hypothetical protein FILTAD_02046 [Filibacter tadaridae]